MKLLTKEIERKLAKAAAAVIDEPISTDDETPIIVKFFDPTGRGTWYATEGERREDGDWLFYGFVVSPLGPDCDEYGSFLLSELQSVRGRFGLGIERDRHLPKGATLGDIIARPKSRMA